MHNLETRNVFKRLLPIRVSTFGPIFADADVEILSGEPGAALRPN